jgi:hypothetical protein
MASKTAPWKGSSSRKCVIHIIIMDTDMKRNSHGQSLPLKRMDEVIQKAGKNVQNLMRLTDSLWRSLIWCR